MPKKFMKCVKEGGKVRTIVPKKGVYIKVCKPKGGGKTIAGEVKHKKK